MENSQTEFSTQKASIKTKNKQENEASNSIQGNIYQLKLLLLFLHRGVSNRYSFRLCTEIEEAKKFKDIMFEYIQDGKKVYRLLQVKHKLDEESKKISAHNLLREKNGDYNLIKYFKSYQSSKKNYLFKDGAIKDVIICTNIDFDFENLKREHIRVEKIEDEDDILNTEGGKKQSQRYRFKKDLAALKEMTEFSADEVKDFLEHLVFAVNQPNPEELGKIIKEELGEIYDFDLIKTENVYNKFFATMLNWFLDKENNKFFSCEDGKELSEEAKRGMPIRFNVKDPSKSFVGRTEQLRALHKYLQNDGATVASQVVAISGLGGIGKSELVRKYINEHSEDYDNKVIWLNAENYQTLAGSFRRLACDRLGISAENVKREKKEMSSIVEDVYKFFSAGKSLFIFDNAERYESQEFDYGIEKFIYRPPNSNGPCILITSRNQKWPSPIIKKLALDAFTEEESTEFIKNLLDIKNNAQEKEIKELSKELQHFPLALQQAVSYIKVEDKMLRNIGLQFKISDYLQRFKIKKTELLHFEFLEDSDNEYTKTTYVTCDITLDAIRENKNGDDALEMLNVISYIAPENIPTKILLFFSKNKKNLVSGIELLKQYSMVYAEQGRLHIHRLLQQVTRVKLRKQNREEEILEKVLKLFSEFNKCLENEIGENHSDTLIAKKGIARASPPQWCPHVVPNGATFHHHGALHHLDNYNEALQIFREIYNSEKATLEKNHPEILDTKEHIATVLLNQCKYNEGFQVYQEVLSIKKEIFGENHPDVLGIRYKLAQILQKQSKYDEALKAFGEIFEEQKLTLGYDNPVTLITQHSIAIVLEEQGKNSEALEVYQEVLSIKKEIFGENHPDVLGIRYRLARILQRQSKYDEALKAFREIFEEQKHTLGYDNPVTSITQHSIAIVLEEQGKNSEALEVYQEVLNKRKVILGNDHIDTLRVSMCIAENFDKLRNFDKALEYYQEILRAQKKVLGEENSETLTTKYNVGIMQYKRKKYDRALQILQEVYIVSKILFPNHPMTLKTKITIANALLIQGKDDKALKMFREILSHQGAVVEKELPEIIQTTFSIVNILIRKGKHGEALRISQEVFKECNTIFGPEHEQTLIVRNGIQQLKMQYNTEVLITAVNNNDLITIESLDKNDIDVNIKDEKDRTLLHHAVNNCNADIVKFLLKNGADITEVTNKGNTPLHIATLNGFGAIVEILLEHASDNRLNDFVDAKTVSENTTSLHVAVKNGFSEIVISLLKHGATYNIKNKAGKTPLELSQKQDVTNLLEIIEEMFADAKIGNNAIVNKLKAMKQDKFKAVTNARNNYGHTLLQVLIHNKHRNIARTLLEMLKNSE